MIERFLGLSVEDEAFIREAASMWWLWGFVAVMVGVMIAQDAGWW